MGFSHIEIFVVLIVVILISFVGFRVYEQNSKKAKADSWTSLGDATVSYSPNTITSKIKVSVYACSTKTGVKAIAVPSINQPYNNGISGVIKLYDLRDEPIQKIKSQSSSNWWSHNVQGFTLNSTVPADDLVFTYDLTGNDSASDNTTVTFSKKVSSLTGCDGNISASSTKTSNNKFEPANNNVYIGVSTPLTTINANKVVDPSILEDFESTAGINNVSIINEFSGLNGNFDNLLSASKNSSQPYTPMISWQLSFIDNKVLNGSLDGNIRARANEIKKYNRPVFIRLNWEFNGTWYKDWGYRPGETAKHYKDSWNHVVNLFKELGVTNAAFVWAPNVWAPNIEIPNNTAVEEYATWYPGNDSVDWIGIDNYPTCSDTGLKGLDIIAQFASIHGKPLALTEWSLRLCDKVNGTVPAKAHRIDEVFKWQNSYPDTVKANLWFNNKGTSKDYDQNCPNKPIPFPSLYLSCLPNWGTRFKDNVKPGTSTTTYLYSPIVN